MHKEKMKDEKVYSATEAREKFADIFDAAHFGQRVVVQKRDRKVAVVAMELLDQLERLLELEAAIDSEKAASALTEFHQTGGKTLKQIKQDLDMG